MNDYDRLNKLLSDIRKTREELEIAVKKANDMYLLFSEMSEDCDAELEEIDENIEDLTDETEADPSQKKKNDPLIDGLRTRRKLVVEASDVLEDVFREFESVSEACAGINVGY